MMSLDYEVLQRNLAYFTLTIFSPDGSSKGFGSRDRTHKDELYKPFKLFKKPNFQDLRWRYIVCYLYFIHLFGIMFVGYWETISYIRIFRIYAPVTFSFRGSSQRCRYCKFLKLLRWIHTKEDSYQIYFYTWSCPLWLRVIGVLSCVSVFVSCRGGKSLQIQSQRICVIVNWSCILNKLAKQTKKGLRFHPFSKAVTLDPYKRR